MKRPLSFTRLVIAGRFIKDAEVVASKNSETLSLLKWAQNDSIVDKEKILGKS